MIRTDDAARDWDAHCEEQERTPHYECQCGKYFEDGCGEKLYRINGDIYCEDCLDEEFGFLA